MSDYYMNLGVLRDTMGEALRENDEQLIYVIASALAGGPVDDAIDLGTLPDLDDHDVDQLVENLRRIADAIEQGEVS